MEKRIWEIKKQQLLSQRSNQDISVDFVNTFMNGTHPLPSSPVGLTGGHFFVVTYSFIGSVS